MRSFILSMWVCALGGVAIADAQPDSTLVQCQVFLDVDGNGIRNDEPGLGDIRFTNGRDILTTDPEGRVDVWVDRAVYRFATKTIPAGFWPTTAWYHWVPVGTQGPETVEFGLRVHDLSANDPVSWVHITDTQADTWGDVWRLDEDLEQINEVAGPPLFVANTGDLVETGSDTTHWNNYVDQLAASDLPVLHVVGNHDTLNGGQPPLEHYESWVGPPYYSVELGSWHLIAYNDENAVVATPAQDDWMAADLAAAPAGSRFALLQHRMLKEIETAKVQAWEAAGVRATFSGHWHALQIADRVEGIVDYNLSKTRAGPIDRTPRVFGLVTMHGDGSIDYEMRRLAVDHRTEITHPQPGQAVGGSAVEVFVQAYDTSSFVSWLSVSIVGPGGAVGAVGLTRVGISRWEATVDVASLPDGGYDLSVTGAFTDGTPINVETSFVRSAVVPIQRRPDTDWPMFRRTPAGSSFVAEKLTPPLSLAWSTPVPGLVALSSPVVAGGKVYFGCRAENDPLGAGVLACDAVTGTLDWFTHVRGGVALAPAVAGDLVIATAMTDSIYAFARETGQPIWSLESDVSRYSLTAPVVSGDTAWVGAEPRPMSVQSSTGSVHWSSDYLGTDFPPGVSSAPSVGSDHVYFGFRSPNFNPMAQGGLAVVDRQTGARLAHHAGSYRSPLWTGTVLYAIGGLSWGSQELTARDAVGNVLWAAPHDLGRGIGAPALGHGVIVATGRLGAIEGIRASDGAGLWTHPVGQTLYDMVDGVRATKGSEAAPAITDSVVYAPSLDGFLYALDLGDGEELWSWYFGTPVASSPAVSGNMLFVAASDGHLYAFVSDSPDPGTAVGHEPGRASVFAFHAPKPNPSWSVTELSWVMPAPSSVRLAIYDVRGRRVRTLVDEQRGAGVHVAEWDGHDRDGRAVAAGIYLVRLEAGSRTLVRKVVRLTK